MPHSDYKLMLEATAQKILEAVGGGSAESPVAETLQAIADAETAIGTKLGTQTGKLEAIRQGLAAVLGSVVRHDAEQTLTDAQKAQARTNIGAIDDTNVVHINDAQTITGAKEFTDSPVVPDVVEADFSQKASNTKFVKTVVRKAVDELQKQINELEGTVLTATEDSTTAYTKAIPTSANLFKYAAIRNFGGRSIAWNQLCDNSAATQTISGVTFTNNSDGSWSVNGTNTSDDIYFKVMTSNVSKVSGHKYIVHGCPIGGSASTYSLYFLDNDFGNGKIVTTANSDPAGVYIFVHAGATVSNLKFVPQLTDLTLAFGAGNEPATVADFLAIFPNDIPAFNAGEIKSAGVNKIVSRGRNLFDADTFFNGVSGWDGEKYVGSVSPLREMGSLYTGFKTGTRYAFSVTAKNVSASNPRFVVNYTDGTHVSAGVFTNPETTLTYVSEAGKTVESITTDYSAAGDVDVKNIQIEEGSTATAYAPYFETEKSIPSSILALPGYGWSAGTAKNWVDWENKIYHQEVGQVDLSELTWNYVDSYFAANLDPAVCKNRGQLLNAKYMYTSAAYGASANMTAFIGNGQVQPILYIKDEAYSDATAFKNSLTADTSVLYVELVTPIETDISALLDDNTIEVESGGSLTFENTNGDSYRIPVPSSVVTMEKP